MKYESEFYSDFAKWDAKLKRFLVVYVLWLPVKWLLIVMAYFGLMLSMATMPYGFSALCYGDFPDIPEFFVCLLLTLYGFLLYGLYQEIRCDLAEKKIDIDKLILSISVLLGIALGVMLMSEHV